MSVSIHIKINEKLFLRNPELSELGINIVKHSILLIDKIGFEAFNFKKLAKEINSTEASIYRYFENKHKLLVYLTSWYWAWLEYLIDVNTRNIDEPDKRLKIIIRIISESHIDYPNIAHINESKLHNIVVYESSKAYLTKNVDEEYREGYFLHYKNLCNRIAENIKAVNPDYIYSNTLASNLIETAHEQIFFAKHLKFLTDIKVKDEDYSGIARFLEHIAFSVLKK
jgi:AcrR family transcriptional regulator